MTRKLWDDLAERKQAILGQLWVNLGYLPLTIHWSCPAGIFNSEAWVGLFGTVAAVAGIRPGWQATALARNARDALTRQPFTVRVDGARMVPTVGGLRWFSREPSLSMPTGEQFTARVVAWTWNQPGAGELDTYEVTMERV